MFKIFNKMNVSEFCGYLKEYRYAKFFESVSTLSGRSTGLYEYQAKIIDFADSELLIMNFVGGGAPFIYDLRESNETIEEAVSKYLNENHFVDETVYVEL